MSNKFLRRAAVLLLTAAALVFAPSVFARTSAPQQPANSDRKTQGQSSSDAQAATETNAPQATPAAVETEAEPLFREFKGVDIGTAGDEPLTIITMQKR